MPEVLEIEQAESEEIEAAEPKWDSWTVEIPSEIIQAQGLANGTLVTLTYNAGKIESEIITPSLKLSDISNRILEKRREVHEELKRLGD
ncbi:MAG: hypothetical protein JSS81_25350 [Acidobacteria bacterium]|nr:hypothetical protein [Acidobacteriota bacterium]